MQTLQKHTILLTTILLWSCVSVLAADKYNGKEFDTEDNLNLYDYGARHYDAAICRWNMQDRYAEKYYACSPYSYCMSNPIGNIDVRGDSVAVLLAPQGAGGAGHMAILIQDENNDWLLYSKNGTEEHGGIWGTNKRNDEGKGIKHKSVVDFLSSDENPIEENGDREYTEAYIIPTTKKQDLQAIEGANKVLKQDYNLVLSNCAQTVQSALRNAGLNDGHSVVASIICRITPNPIWGLMKDKAISLIPKSIYQIIKIQNKEGETIYAP